MRILGAVAAGLLTGVLSGFGIGGGSLLLLYLTLFAGLSRRGRRLSNPPARLGGRAGGALRRAC